MTSRTAPVARLEELDRDECLELLRHAGVGRVVLSADCLPVAYPVNVSVLDGDVVFSTGMGTKLDAALRGEVISIETDHFDTLYHTGWSVLVTGVAQVITDLDSIEGADRLLTQPWAQGAARSLVRVPATRISGRRLALGPPVDDEVEP